MPPLDWESGRIPNDGTPTPHVRIGDEGLTVRLKDDTLLAEMTPWAWKAGHGKPVFNLKSEGRDFSKSGRVAILATLNHAHCLDTYQSSQRIRAERCNLLPAKPQFYRPWPMLTFERGEWLRNHLAEAHYA